VLAVAALLFMITGGVYRYASSRAYLIDENGVVVVYRGVPGAIGGFRLHWLEQVSDVRVEDLPLSTAAQLRDGVTADSLQQAYAVLSAYRVEAARNSQPQTSTPSPTSTPIVPTPGTTGSPVPTGAP
jgi:protein phosphatase